jgi:hypothetical protein
VDGLHFLRNVVAVCGQVVGDGYELGEEAPGGDEEDRGEGEDDQQGGHGSRKAKSFEQGDNGGEQEGEEDGECKGQQEDFGEIQDGDGQDRNCDEPELRKDACG